MSSVRRLRWTEQAVDQLGAIAEYVSRTSPVYAEQLVQRIVHRLEQVRVFPESGSPVAEASSPEVRQVIEWPYRTGFAAGDGAMVRAEALASLVSTARSYWLRRS